LIDRYVHVPAPGRGKPRLWTARKMLWGFGPRRVREANGHSFDDLAGLEAVLTVDADAYSLQEGGRQVYHTTPQSFDERTAVLGDVLRRWDLRPEGPVYLSRSDGPSGGRRWLADPADEGYLAALSDHLAGFVVETQAPPRPGEMSPQLRRALRQNARTITAFGPPGAGKGTVLDELLRQLNDGYPPEEQYVKLVMGDYFRGIDRLVKKVNIQPGDEETYGRFLDPENEIISKLDLERMEAGEMMSDAAAFRIVNAVLMEPKFANAYGILFDGFPRTPVQLDAVDEHRIYFNGKPLAMDLTLVLDISEEVLLGRIQRRAKENADAGLPERPDAPLDPVKQRTVLDTRLRDFRRLTVPMISAVLGRPGTAVVPGDAPGLSREDSEIAVREGLFGVLEARYGLGPAEVTVHHKDGRRVSHAYRPRLGPPAQDVDDVVPPAQRADILAAAAGPAQSVVIAVPTIDSAGHFDATLAHLAPEIADLHTKHPDWTVELVVAVNGPDQEATLQKVLDAQRHWPSAVVRFTVLRVEPTSKVHAMNALAGYAKHLQAGLLVFADDDNIYKEGTLADGLEKLLAAGELALVGPRIEPPSPKTLWEHLTYRARGLYPNALPWGALMMLHTSAYPIISSRLSQDDTYLSYYFLDDRGGDIRRRIIVSQGGSVQHASPSTFFKHIRRVYVEEHARFRVMGLLPGKAAAYATLRSDRGVLSRALANAGPRWSGEWWLALLSLGLLYGTIRPVRYLVRTELKIRRWIGRPKPVKLWTPDPATKIHVRSSSSNGSAAGAFHAPDGNRRNGAASVLRPFVKAWPFTVFGAPLWEEALFRWAALGDPSGYVWAAAAAFFVIAFAAILLRWYVRALRSGFKQGARPWRYSEKSETTLFIALLIPAALSAVVYMVKSLSLGYGWNAVLLSGILFAAGHVAARIVWRARAEGWKHGWKFWLYPTRGDAVDFFKFLIPAVLFTGFDVFLVNFAELSDEQAAALTGLSHGIYNAVLLSRILPLPDKVYDWLLPAAIDLAPAAPAADAERLSRGGMPVEEVIETTLAVQGLHKKNPVKVQWIGALRARLAVMPPEDLQRLAAERRFTPVVQAMIKEQNERRGVFDVNAVLAGLADELQRGFVSARVFWAGKRLMTFLDSISDFWPFLKVDTALLNTVKSLLEAGLPELAEEDTKEPPSRKPADHDLDLPWADTYFAVGDVVIEGNGLTVRLAAMDPAEARTQWRTTFVRPDGSTGESLFWLEMKKPAAIFIPKERGDTLIKVTAWGIDGGRLLVSRESIPARKPLPMALSQEDRADVPVLSEDELDMIDALLESHRYREAKDQLKVLTRMFFWEPAVWVRLARANQGLNKQKTALWVTATALAVWPDEPELWDIQTRALAGVGDSAAALQNAQEAAARFPSRAATRAALSQIFHSIGRREEAADEAAEAVRLAQTPFELTLALAQHAKTLNRLGRFRGALDAARAAEDIDPENLDIQNSLARALISLNMPEEAEVILDGVLAVDPDNFYAGELMKQVLGGMARGSAEDFSDVEAELLRAAGESTEYSRLEGGFLDDAHMALFGPAPAPGSDKVFWDFFFALFGAGLFGPAATVDGVIVLHREVAGITHRLLLALRVPMAYEDFEARLIRHEWAHVLLGMAVDRNPVFMGRVDGPGLVARTVNYLREDHEFFATLRRHLRGLEDASEEAMARELLANLLAPAPWNDESARGVLSVMPLNLRRLRDDLGLEGDESWETLQGAMIETAPFVTGRIPMDLAHSAQALTAFLDERLAAQADGAPPASPRRGPLRLLPSAAEETALPQAAGLSARRRALLRPLSAADVLLLEDIVSAGAHSAAIVALSEYQSVRKKYPGRFPPSINGLSAALNLPEDRDEKRAVFAGVFRAKERVEALIAPLTDEALEDLIDNLERLPPSDQVMNVVDRVTFVGVRPTGGIPDLMDSGWPYFAALVEIAGGAAFLRRARAGFPAMDETPASGIQGALSSRPAARGSAVVQAASRFQRGRRPPLSPEARLKNARARLVRALLPLTSSEVSVVSNLLTAPNDRAAIAAYERVRATNPMERLPSGAAAWERLLENAQEEDALNRSSDAKRRLERLIAGLPAAKRGDFFSAVSNVSADLSAIGEAYWPETFPGDAFERLFMEAGHWRFVARLRWVHGHNARGPQLNELIAGFFFASLLSGAWALAVADGPLAAVVYVAASVAAFYATGLALLSLSAAGAGVWGWANRWRVGRSSEIEAPPAETAAPDDVAESGDAQRPGILQRLNISAFVSRWNPLEWPRRAAAYVKYRKSLLLSVAFAALFETAVAAPIDTTFTVAMRGGGTKALTLRSAEAADFKELVELNKIVWANSPAIKDDPALASEEGLARYLGRDPLGLLVTVDPETQKIVGFLYSARIHSAGKDTAIGRWNWREMTDPRVVKRRWWVGEKADMRVFFSVGAHPSLGRTLRNTGGQIIRAAALEIWRHEPETEYFNTLSPTNYANVPMALPDYEADLRRLRAENSHLSENAFHLQEGIKHHLPYEYIDPDTGELKNLDGIWVFHHKINKAIPAASFRRHRPDNPFSVTYRYTEEVQKAARTNGLTRDALVPPRPKPLLSVIRGAGVLRHAAVVLLVFGVTLYLLNNPADISAGGLLFAGLSGPYFLPRIDEASAQKLEALVAAQAAAASPAQTLLRDARSRPVDLRLRDAVPVHELIQETAQALRENPAAAPVAAGAYRRYFNAGSIHEVADTLVGLSAGSAAPLAEAATKADVTVFFIDSVWAFKPARWTALLRQTRETRSVVVTKSESWGVRVLFALAGVNVIAAPFETEDGVTQAQVAAVEGELMAALNNASFQILHTPLMPLSYDGEDARLEDAVRNAHLIDGLLRIPVGAVPLNSILDIVRHIARYA